MCPRAVHDNLRPRAFLDTPSVVPEAGAVRVLFWYRGMENLGLGYLMSMLKHHGHEVDLIFEPGLDDNGWLRLPPLDAFNRHDALMERAKAFRPDLVAIGAPTNLWPHASRAAMRLKAELGVPIVVGGHHAQGLPEYVISQPYVDIVCTGEGEIALAELANRLEAGADITDIPTLWVKQDGVIHRNEIGPLENNLDAFPYPEKQLWREYGCFRDNLEVFTGRGCPFKCTFCNIHHQRELFEGKGDFLRKRSVENVIAELEHHLRRYDVRYVSLHDDNFTTNVRWVEEFCDVYTDRIGLPWYCFGYPTTIKPRLLRAMKGANCSMIFMGVDSGDAEVRSALMERPMTDELIYEKARLLHEHGITSFLSTVYGAPGETDTQMMKTLDMVANIRPTQCSGNVFYPLPKTKLHDRAVAEGYLTEEGQEKVRLGLSSFHHESILDHPHKALAETLATMTPVYAKAPDAVRPLLRRMIDRRMHRTAKAIYAALIPITFTFIGKEAIVSGLIMMRQAMGLRKRRPQRDEPAVVGPTGTAEQAPARTRLQVAVASITDPHDDEIAVVTEKHGA